MERAPKPVNEMGLKRSPEMESVKPELAPEIKLPSKVYIIASVIAAMGYFAGFTWMQFKQNRTYSGALQADAFYLTAIAAHSIAVSKANKNRNLD